MFSIKGIVWSRVGKITCFYVSYNLQFSMTITKWMPWNRTYKILKKKSPLLAFWFLKCTCFNNIDLSWIYFFIWWSSWVCLDRFSMLFSTYNENSNLSNYRSLFQFANYAIKTNSFFYPQYGESWNGDITNAHCTNGHAWLPAKEKL